MANIDDLGTRPSVLADRSALSRPAMAEVLDELEEPGYLRRVDDPRDGRAKLVKLTARGRDCVAAARIALSELEAQFEEVVGRRSYAMIRRSLQELIDRFEPATRSLAPVVTAVGPCPAASHGKARRQAHERRPGGRKSHGCARRGAFRSGCGARERAGGRDRWGRTSGDAQRRRSPIRNGGTSSHLERQSSRWSCARHFPSEL